MKKSVLLFCVTGLLLHSAIAQDKIVTGFLPVYRTLPENYDYSRLTHLIYFSLIPKGDGGFSWTSGRDSLTMYNTFQETKAKIAAQPLAKHQTEKAKIILSIGGTSEVGSGGFNEIAADPAITKLFVSRVKAILDLWGADGVDIDWERWLKTQADSDNHEAFLKTLSDTLWPAGYKIFTDVSASNWNGQWFNTKSADYVDYIQPMAYTFSGSWSSETMHNSSMSQAQSALSYWVGRGISKEKLVLGVPFYGIGFGGTDQVGVSFSGTSSLGQYVDYKQVLQALEGGLYQHSAEGDSDGPYIYRSDDSKEIIFYNDTTIIAKKAEYIVENGYAGAMIWELGQDVEGEVSLLDRLATTLLSWKKSGSAITVAQYPLAAEITTMLKGNRLTIAMDQSTIKQVSLWNARGQQLQPQMLNGNTLSVENFAQGLYIMKIETTDNRLITTSFIR